MSIGLPHRSFTNLLNNTGTGSNSDRGSPGLPVPPKKRFWQATIFPCTRFPARRCPWGRLLASFTVPFASVLTSLKLVPLQTVTFRTLLLLITVTLRTVVLHRTLHLNCRADIRCTTAVGLVAADLN